MSVIDEIKERLDIVDVISGYVPLKKAGRSFKGLCPFHAEKTPSFVVFPDSQTWHCFGACGTGGDVFSFIMKRENMDFSEALRFLAQRAGVELATRSEAQIAEDKRQERLREINAAAAAYYHNLLLISTEGERARAHLTKRAVNQETIKRFQLGYALDDWQALSTYLLSKGYHRDDLLSAGLIIEREDGSGYYDRFRGRLIIPIRDQRGRVIGFGARALDNSEPKYLNSPQTPLFDKGRVLFGIDLARGAIRAEDTAVIVEGYMDVIQAHQHGMANVVASMGTALTEAQVKLLKRFAGKIVLALDADVAGTKAAVRGLDLSRQITLHEVVKIGPALVESQYSSEADVRIAILPQGKDPDEVIREAPERWAQMIQDALPVIDYYFQLLTADLDLTSPQGKSTAVRQLTPIIRDIEDRVQQAHYLQKLSRLVRVDERVLQGELSRGKRRKVGKASEWETSKSLDLEAPVFGLEEHCLSTLLQQPDLLSLVDGLLADIGAKSLGGDDFAQVENQQIFLALQEHLSTGQRWDLNVFWEGLEATLRGRLDLLLERSRISPPISDEKREKDAVDSLLRLREEGLRGQIKELRFLQEDAQVQRDGEAMADYSRLVNAYTDDLREIQQLLDMRSISGRRRRAENVYDTVAIDEYEMGTDSLVRWRDDGKAI